MTHLWVQKQCFESVIKDFQLQTVGFATIHEETLKSKLGSNSIPQPIFNFSCIQSILLNMMVANTQLQSSLHTQWAGTVSENKAITGKYG